LPLLVAFLAGALSGIASLWPTGTRNVTQAASPAMIGAAVVESLPAPRLQLDGDVADRDAGAFGRNLFAFLEPPRPRMLVVRQVSTPIVTPAPAPVTMQPVVVEPAAPTFPYRYIGTFGPRENVFAVFARDGDVINIRAGEMIAEGFRLHRIDGESVEVSWSEDRPTIRVPLTR
jgi:hypothetical protein